MNKLEPEEKARRIKERSRIYREKNREKLAEKKRELYNSEDGLLRAYNKSKLKEYRLKFPEQFLFCHAKSRAKKKLIPFTITVQDIKIPKICPVLGIELFVSNIKVSPNSPSLDRFIPELGYIPGNVFVISYKANTIKNNATLEEFNLVLKYMQGNPSFE